MKYEYTSDIDGEITVRIIEQTAYKHYKSRMNYERLFKCFTIYMAYSRRMV